LILVKHSIEERIKIGTQSRYINFVSQICGTYSYEFKTAYFNNALFNYFCKKILRRFPELDGFIQFHISSNKKNIYCAKIPTSSKLWFQIKYMIVTINNATWLNDGRKHICVDCDPLWRLWGQRCLNCQAIKCDKSLWDNSIAEPSIECEFNQLMFETFGI